MTFTPQVLTQIDNNNCVVLSSSATFIGTATLTTGFNTIILTIGSTEDSDSGGIQIDFSDDNSTWITPYTDTYFATNIFTKNYLIIKKYYRIKYLNSLTGTFTITSRLSTDLDSSIVQSTSINVFDNNVQNTLDAFGKLRVANPTTLLDMQFPGQSTGTSDFLKNNLQISSASAGAGVTGTYQNSKLVIQMPFTVSSSKYYISQSRSYSTYQPGKSLLFLASGIYDPAGSGGDIETFKNSLNNSGDTISARVGYFDSSAASLSTNIPIVTNGIFLQINYNNTGGTQTRTVSVNIANNGSVTSIPQSSWNIDKMDGSGPSGLNLDFTRAQLFTADMEWLGVGRVRFGFYAYGRIQYCHQVININVLNQPYTTSINLPICFSLFGTSAGTSFTGNLTQICSTVISEGGYNPFGRPFSISNGSTGVTVTATETPVLFLRGGSSNYYHQTIIPTGLSMICDNNNILIAYKLVLFLDGVSLASAGIVTPSWTTVNTNSVTQYAVSFTGGGTYSSSNGIVLDNGYFYGKGTNTFAVLTNIFSSLVVQLNSNVNNVADVLVLTATLITGGGTASVYGTLQWQELY
jgi:hypothetical protein